MKNKALSFILLTALGFSTGQLAIPSAAADGVGMVDFTSYLACFLKKNCSDAEADRPMNQMQKAAVVSKNKKHNRSPYGEDADEIRTVYKLKNAEFMGFPLVQIEETEEYEKYEWKLTFADTRFLNLSKRLVAAKDVEGAVVSDTTKAVLFDRNGKRLPKISQVHIGCMDSFLIFDAEKRTMTKASGCY